MSFVEIDCKKKKIFIHPYACLVNIISSISFSALNAFAFSVIHPYGFSLFYDFSHAYPETAYITATPTGTIGPITVSLFSTSINIECFLFV